MRKTILLVVLSAASISVYAQKKALKPISEQMAVIGHEKKDSEVNDPSKFVKWVTKKVKIGQSMETADQRAEPAQFQLTLPRKDTSSYLINLGMNVRLDFANWLYSNSYTSKLKVEYHKNTLTEKKQDNFEAGYQGTWNFAATGDGKTLFFVAFDPKYNYDRVSKKSSAAGNFLFSWTTEKSRINWNTNTYQADNQISEFFSIFAGAQAQQVLQTKTDSGTGFILRPIYTAQAAVAWNRKNKIHKPILKLTASYTGRWDVINKTVEGAGKEGYTDLLKCGLDWYVITEPLKVSLGGSYNRGSDPLKGLEDQQFWLISVNVAL